MISVWVQTGLREVCRKITKRITNFVTMVHFNPCNLRSMYHQYHFMNEKATALRV